MKPINTSEEETDLILRLKKGQEWAVNTLVKKYQGMLLKIAYSITLDREESLEIVQDVFIKACQNISGFRQESSLGFWLRQITIHMCLNWKRKMIRRFRWSHKSIDSEDVDVLKEIETDEQSPEDQYREKEFEDIIMKRIAKLPEKIRVVFLLNAIEGLSYDEIAQHLKVKRGTVSSRLYHARKILMDAATV